MLSVRTRWGTRHLLFISFSYVVTVHLPLQEVGEIKRAANENDNKVIPICELLYIYVYNIVIWYDKDTLGLMG